METRAIYTERKTFVKYDDNHYLLYLNEEVLENHVPERPRGRTGTGALHGLRLYRHVRGWRHADRGRGCHVRAVRVRARTHEIFR